MNALDLEFYPQLATDPVGMTVNSFARFAATRPSSLVLRPVFQRNLVWNETQKSFLIDSILRGLPVPELYMQTSTGPDGEERHVVVDGQQRISTCLAFLDGSLRLEDSDDLNPVWRGKKFIELDDRSKSRFREFRFVVRSLPSAASEAVLREIFRRLNRTVEALEDQELRHAAFTGGFLTLVERAGAAEALEDLGVFSPKDYRRRRNDEFVAEVLFAVDAGAYPNKKEGLEQVFLTYERQGLPAEHENDMSRRFGRAIRFIGRIASDLRKTRFRNKSDCYSLLVFLSRNAERISEDPAFADEFVARLRDFSTEVNAAKRSESVVMAEDDGRTWSTNVLAYLRAVERAASDRLNRVRRHDALHALLGDLLAAQPAAALVPEDGSWEIATDEIEEMAAVVDVVESGEA